MKKRLLIIGLFILLLSYGCSETTKNEIYNTSYDVNIDINDISKAFVPAVKKASESTIGISTYIRHLFAWESSSTGSGVVYKAYAVMKNGDVFEDITETKNSNNVLKYVYYAITNQHVVSETDDNYKIKAYFGDEKTMTDAQLLGYNANEDLAVISFETTLYITPITLANSDNVQKGDIVVAVGSSGGYEYYNSASLGIVSYPKRYMSVKRDTNLDGITDTEIACEFIQHDASINSGNSGGALVNINGELIGINTLKLYDDKVTVEGMGFAIPSNVIKLYLTNLEQGILTQKEEISGRLYSVNEIRNRDVYKNIPDVSLDNAYDYGIYVYSLRGIWQGKITDNDLILEINDKKINDVNTFKAIVRYSDAIKLKVIRDNEEIIVTI